MSRSKAKQIRELVASLRPTKRKREAAREREARKREQEEKQAKGWQPKKSQYGKLVFLNAETGKPSKKVFRQKVFLAQVSKKGKVRFLKPNKKQKGFAARAEFFEPELRPKLKGETIELYRKRLEPVILRETSHKGAFGFKDLDKVALGQLKTFGKRYRGNKKVLFEASLKAGKERIKVTIGLSFAQLQKLKKGETTWLKDYLWKQLSTELSMENTVTVGSANYIAKLPRNKGKKPSQWRTKTGEVWGKHTYKKVRLSDIETKIFTLKK